MDEGWAALSEALAETGIETPAQYFGVAGLSGRATAGQRADFARLAAEVFLGAGLLGRCGVFFTERQLLRLFGALLLRGYSSSSSLGGAAAAAAGCAFADVCACSGRYDEDALSGEQQAECLARRALIFEQVYAALQQLCPVDSLEKQLVCRCLLPWLEHFVASPLLTGALHHAATSAPALSPQLARAVMQLPELAAELARSLGRPTTATWPASLGRDAYVRGALCPRLFGALELLRDDGRAAVLHGLVVRLLCAGHAAAVAESLAAAHRRPSMQQLLCAVIGCGSSYALHGLLRPLFYLLRPASVAALLRQPLVDHADVVYHALAHSFVVVEPLLPAGAGGQARSLVLVLDALQLLHRAVAHWLAVWSDASFVQRSGSDPRYAFVSKLLLLALPRCPARLVSDQCSAPVLNGVQLCLQSSLQHVRHAGMRVAECFSRIVHPDNELRFDELADVPLDPELTVTDEYDSIDDMTINNNDTIDDMTINNNDTIDDMTNRQTINNDTIDDMTINNVDHDMTNRQTINNDTIDDTTNRLTINNVDYDIDDDPDVQFLKQQPRCASSVDTDDAAVLRPYGAASSTPSLLSAALAGQPRRCEAASSVDPDELVALDSDASSSESSDEEELVPYDLPEESEQDVARKKHRMAFLRDALSALQATDDAQRVELGLGAVTALIEKAPDDLADLSTHLAAALLRLEERYRIANFDEQRGAALAGLVVHDSVTVVRYLCREFFRINYSIRHRLDMLDALRQGAERLAAAVVAVDATPAAETAPLRLVGRTLRRLAAAEQPSGGQRASNRFAPIAGEFLFPLLASYDRFEGGFNLLGEDTAVLSRLFVALATFVECAGPGCPVLLRMIRAVLEFCLALRYHRDCFVRRAILYAVFTGCLTAARCATVLTAERLLSTEEESELKSWLHDVQAHDLDNDCRTMAGDLARIFDSS